MPSTSPKQHREVGDPASECPRCLSDRTWKHATKDGRMWRQYCTRCHSANSYASRKLRAKSYNAQNAARRQTEPLFRGYELWNGAKHRARCKGLVFTLSRERVEKALVHGFCEVTGLLFDLRIKGKRMGSLSPSIDRRDPTLGYTDENSQIVCWVYNRAKGDGSHDDVLLLAEALNAQRLKTAA